jgi:hypothetical protein
MAVYEPLDFSQPQNKLTEVAEQIRKSQIARNDYQLGNQYGAASADAISDGDIQGKGTGVFLDTSRGGHSVDMADRKNEIKINQYQAGTPYQVPGN